LLLRGIDTSAGEDLGYDFRTGMDADLVEDMLRVVRTRRGLMNYVFEGGEVVRGF
jgi:hypothetical protein